MDSKTKKLTAAAMICALAYVMVLVGRVPVVLFLKYDPKDIVIALGGFIWGPFTSFLTSVVVSIIEMLTISDTGLWGLVMNIISTSSFACTAALIYKKKRTLSGAVIGLVSGVFLMAVMMLLWNYLVTPIYMGVPRGQIAKMLANTFLPFNLLKGGLNAAGTFLLYRPVTAALRQINYIPPSASATKKKAYTGLLIISGAIIITCVLFILAFNDII